MRDIAKRLEDLRKDRRNVLNRIHALIDAHDMPAKKEKFCDEEWKAQAKEALPADTWLVLETLFLHADLLFELSGSLEKGSAEIIGDRNGARRLRQIPVGRLGPV